MLILTRKFGESILIEDENGNTIVTIHVLPVFHGMIKPTVIGSRIKLGIEGDTKYRVYRTELKNIPRST